MITDALHPLRSIAGTHHLKTSILIPGRKYQCAVMFISQLVRTHIGRFQVSHPIIRAIVLQNVYFYFILRIMDGISLILNTETNLLMRLVAVYLRVAADLCQYIHPLLQYPKTSTESGLVFAFGIIINRQPIVTGKFWPYLIVRQRQPIVRVGQGSVDRDVVIFYRIVVEAIQIFRFREIRRRPVCITMCEYVLVAVIIVCKMVERNFHGFIFTQSDDRRSHIVIIGNDLYRSYMGSVHFCTLGMQPTADDTSKEEYPDFLHPVVC